MSYSVSFHGLIMYLSANWSIWFILCGMKYEARHVVSCVCVKL